MERFAQLIEQPRVLNGDHGLVREGAQQFSLLVGKRPRIAPYDVQRANRLIAAHHRHYRHGAVSAGQQILCPCRQFLRRLMRVSKINFAPVKDRCARDKLVRQRHRKAPPQGLDTGFVRPANSAELDQIMVGKRNGHDRIRKQVQSAADDGVEGRLRVGRRVTDDLENFRRRRLLLQRFAQVIRALTQLIEQPRILDGDNGLRGEVLDQLDLLLVERPHLLAIDRDRADQLAFFQ